MSREKRTADNENSLPIASLPAAFISSVQECDATGDANCFAAGLIKIPAQQKTFPLQHQFFLNFRLQHNS